MLLTVELMLSAQSTTLDGRRERLARRRPSGRWPASPRIERAELVAVQRADVVGSVGVDTEVMVGSQAQRLVRAGFPRCHRRDEDLALAVGERLGVEHAPDGADPLGRDDTSEKALSRTRLE